MTESVPLPQDPKWSGRHVRVGLWENRTSRRRGRPERSGRVAAESWLCAAEIFLSAGRVDREVGREVSSLLDATETGKKVSDGQNRRGGKGAADRSC